MLGIENPCFLNKMYSVFPGKYLCVDNAKILMDSVVFSVPLQNLTSDHVKENTAYFTFRKNFTNAKT